MATLPALYAPVNSALTLRHVIRGLIGRSSVNVRPDGVREYRFAGVITEAVCEAIWAAFRAGQLDSHEGVLYATRRGCHVAFSFGSGSSTATFVRFSFVDERTAA